MGWAPQGDCRLIYEFLPDDTSRQAHSLDQALLALNGISTGAHGVTLVDLGCGTGGSYYVFSGLSGKIAWVGLDITDSYEVLNRRSRDLPFCAYDGTRIPLADSSADIVYSHQVFEHVRHPAPVVAEVLRVLRPGGWFVGSTSHLEPLHSRSYWNYTPYGFCVLLQDAGFHSIRVRPGIDALTLISRRGLSYLGLSPIFKPFFKVESPLNAFLEAGMRVAGVPVRRRNFLKLVFAGHFCFSAQK